MLELNAHLLPLEGYSATLKLELSISLQIFFLVSLLQLALNNKEHLRLQKWLSVLWLNLLNSNLDILLESSSIVAKYYS
jgi:hypothetical protein